MPLKDPTARRAFDAAYRRRRNADKRADGVCKDCPTKLTDGLSRCPVCRDRQRAEKQERMDKGVCEACARPKDNPALVKCCVCREPHHFNPMLRR